jgi:hypothetical protein
MHVTCLALLNELGEVIGFQNKDIVAVADDTLKVKYEFKVQDYDPLRFLRSLFA